MNMKNALMLAAIVEAGTGLAMLIVPVFVWQLIFGEQLTGVGIPVARVGAMALIGLGIACWPGPPLVAMLTYGALATLYVAYIGFSGGFNGIFLWPVVIIHVILIALLARHVNRMRDAKS